MIRVGIEEVAGAQAVHRVTVGGADAGKCVSLEQFPGWRCLTRRHAGELVTIVGLEEIQQRIVTLAHLELRQRPARGVRVHNRREQREAHHLRPQLCAHVTGEEPTQGVRQQSTGMGAEEGSHLVDDPVGEVLQATLTLKSGSSAEARQVEVEALKVAYRLKCRV